jgi:hypothetical protein
MKTKQSLLLLAAVLALGACHSLTPAQQAKADKFECQVKALAPLVEPALDAAELARDLYAGTADIDRVVTLLGATQPEVDALNARLRACESPVPAPAAEAKL